MKFLKKILSIAIIFLIVNFHHHESPIQDKNANFHSEDCIDQDCFNERTDCETCLTQNRLAFQSIRSEINTTDFENKYVKRKQKKLTKEIKKAKVLGLI